MQFIIISVIGLIIRTPLFAYLEKVCSKYFATTTFPTPFTPTFLGHNISLAVTIIVVMFWNFFANRYWTYGDIS
jgi:hypothetical protein